MTTEETETSVITYTLTCHTEGCGNADIPISLDMPEGCAAMCGVCGQPITDVTPEGAPREGNEDG
jgi:hypothetical protein